MTHRLRTLATGTAVIAGLLVLSAEPAQARPTFPAHDTVRQSDVGPDQRDWYCTYQVDVDDVTCVYSPGNGSTSGRELVKPWSWRDLWPF